MSDLTTGTQAKAATIPKKIRDLVIDRSTELVWDGEHAFAVLQTPNHVRTLPVGSAALRRWIHQGMTAQGTNPPTREALATAERAIEARADQRAEELGGAQPTPSIRVAGRDGAVFIDLGGSDWRCVRVTAAGWSIEPHPIDGPYMYRPPRMAALPEPARGGSIEDLWQFINVGGQNERRLLVAAMVQMLWPRGPYPVLVVFGQQGSAKTTTQEMVKSLVDPSRPSPDNHALTSLRKPPREDRDAIAAARAMRVIGFDNVSHLDEWLSDTICRLATGAEQGGRELFSDFDEAVVSLARPVMLNGIPEIVGKADLADRAIKIECTPPAARREAAELWREFDRARPRLLGALLDLLVLALSRYQEASVPTEIDVRMADFARLGEGIAPGLGLGPGEFTQRFHDNRSAAAREVAELDSITARIEGVLRRNDGPWAGSIDELRAALTDGHLDIGRGWWSSPQALSNHLRRQTAPLRAAGIEVRKLGRGYSPITGKQRELVEVSLSG